MTAVMGGNPAGMMSGPGGAGNVLFAQNAQQQQMQRIQRQSSIPQGAQHLPGELSKDRTAQGLGGHGLTSGVTMTESF